MGKLIGYARVSTGEQELALQLRELEKAGCAQVFEDHGQSGRTFDRPGLNDALLALEAGDTLVIWKLDRLGRSLPDLITTLAELGARKVNFISLTDSIDTSTAGGRLMFHVMGALAEFERDLISERTKAGLAAAKASGRSLGRPPALTPQQIEHARALKKEGRSPAEIARLFKVSRPTLYRALKPETLAENDT